MKTAIQTLADNFEGRFITTAFMPLSVAKNFYRMWINTNGKNRYSHLFEQFTTKRPAYRLYVPVSNHLRINTAFSPIEIEVINALHNYAQGKYDLLDYFNAKVMETTGKKRILNLNSVLKDINAPLVKTAMAAADNNAVFAKIDAASFTVAGDGKGTDVKRYQLFNSSTRTGIPFAEFTKDLDAATLIGARDAVLDIEAKRDADYAKLTADMKKEGKNPPRRKDEPINVEEVLTSKFKVDKDIAPALAGIVSESIKSTKEGKQSKLPKRATSFTAEQKRELLADAVMGSATVWDTKLMKPRKIDRLFIEGLGWTPLDDLMNRVAADPIRADAASSASDMAIVISRHPYDVASVSTGRAWTSCLNLGGVQPHNQRGSNAHRIPASIRYGSLAVYGIRADDGNIKNPVCRVTLMPFVNTKDPDDIILDVSSGSNYGKWFPGFERTLRQWLACVNHGNKGGTYKIISQKPYSDIGGDRNWPSFSQSEDVEGWCQRLGITGYKVDSDGFITVNGNVKLSSSSVDKRFNTLPIKFKEVTGDFIVDDIAISSMKGFPVKVGKNFSACRSGITSLEDGPEHVGGNYLVEDCKSLTTVIGFPKFVGADFSANRSNLQTLRGIPEDSVVVGSFECSRTGLRRIDGFPGEVQCKVTPRYKQNHPLDNDPEATGRINFNNCNIQTTVGLPTKINGDLLMSQNKALEDLVGFPQHVVGHVSLSDCPLRDLAHLNNTKIEGTLQISDGDLTDEDVAQLKPLFIGGGIQFSNHRLTKKVKLPPNVKYGLWLGSDLTQISFSNPDSPKVFLTPFDQRPVSDSKFDQTKKRDEVKKQEKTSKKSTKTQD